MDYQGKYSEMMRNADEKIAKFRNVRRFSVDENDFVQSERFKFTRGLIELKKSNPSRIEDCMARDKTVPRKNVEVKFEVFRGKSRFFEVLPQIRSISK
jgi:hypothetical protein